MEQPPNMFILNTLPGIQRDGTTLDAKYYSDGLWTRFQRGRPRKIGGYRQYSAGVLARVRKLLFTSDAGTNQYVYLFGDYGIQSAIANVLTTTTPTTVSPVGFVPLTDSTWQAAEAYGTVAGVASNTKFIFAATSPDRRRITSNTAGPVYVMVPGTVVPAVALTDGVSPIMVSGGCCSIGPYLFVYGSDGLLRNSNPNVFEGAAGWTGGSSNSANPVSSKVVYGENIRGGGQAPAGLFWSLDSLIRVTFVGGAPIWKYDVVSSSISVLGKNTIVEYDGVYYWPGIDRFYMYNGVVQELPNAANLNLFFDLVKPNSFSFPDSPGNSCYVVKIPRFGEIWWVTPVAGSGAWHAVIYNVREKTWYDTQMPVRTAGLSQQVSTNPFFAGGSERSAKQLLLSSALLISEGAGIGSSSGGVGIVAAQTRNFPGIENLITVVVSAGTFLVGDTVALLAGAGVIVSVSDVVIDELWLHEFGVDKTEFVPYALTAIPASFETDRFNFMTGGPSGDALGGNNLQTRIVRVEPDFVMPDATTMTVKVRGTSYANSPEVTSDAFSFTNLTEFIDMREQRRECSLVFESNQIGGDFQMGSVVLTVEPGDVRG